MVKCVCILNSYCQITFFKKIKFATMQCILEMNYSARTLSTVLWKFESYLPSQLLLLLLSRFSRVRFCATPYTAAHQAPPSLGFSRQEHWSGLPFPSPMHESEKWKWSCSVVSGPHGLQPTRLLRPWIFQARVLEWGAIAFSESRWGCLKRCCKWNMAGGG